MLTFCSCQQFKHVIYMIKEKGPVLFFSCTNMLESQSSYSYYLMIVKFGVWTFIWNHYIPAFSCQIPICYVVHRYEEWPSTILCHIVTVMLRSRGKCSYIWWISSISKFSPLIITPYTNLKIIVDLSIIFVLKVIWQPFWKQSVNYSLENESFFIIWWMNYELPNWKTG